MSSLIKCYSICKKWNNKKLLNRLKNVFNVNFERMKRNSAKALKVDLNTAQALLNEGSEHLEKVIKHIYFREMNVAQGW